ncbi:MAG TPA: hypothetical protein VIY52_18250 [Streptosporangiaceae bacterium]
MHILAGHGGQPPGFAAMEITVPPHLAGSIPHAHDDFDEAIYVLSRPLLVLGDDEPQEAPPGSMFVAPAGTGTASAIPLARWPGAGTVSPALALMRDIGAAFSPDAPPDPDRIREIYARHASRLLP